MINQQRKPSKLHKLISTSKTAIQCNPNCAKQTTTIKQHQTSKQTQSKHKEINKPYEQLKANQQN